MFQNIHLICSISYEIESSSQSSFHLLNFLNEIICKVIAADGEMRASKALRQVIDFEISRHILAAVRAAGHLKATVQ